eukprot:263798-Chlamydomonas_euryale.AAC.3
MEHHYYHRTATIAVTLSFPAYAMLIHWPRAARIERRSWELRSNGVAVGQQHPAGLPTMNFESLNIVACHHAYPTPGRGASLPPIMPSCTCLPRNSLCTSSPPSTAPRALPPTPITSVALTVSQVRWQRVLLRPDGWGAQPLERLLFGAPGWPGVAVVRRTWLACSGCCSAHLVGPEWLLFGAPGWPGVAVIHNDCTVAWDGDMDVVHATCLLFCGKCTPALASTTTMAQMEAHLPLCETARILRAL